MKLHETLELSTVNELKQLRGLIPLSDRSTRKDAIIAAIAYHLLSADLRSVWERLSELEIDVIAEAVHNWGGYFDRTRFKAKYGALPSAFYSRTYTWHDREREKEPPSMLPLFLYAGEIPEDLRPRLAELAPPPAEAEVAVLTDEDLPEIVDADADGEGGEPLRRVATEALVRHDLPAVLRLIAQGRITVGAKTGAPGKVSVERLEQVLLGGDWYSAEDDLDLDRRQGGSIRPIRPFAWPLLLQTGGLAKRDGSKLALTARGKKALSQPIEEVVSSLFDRWRAKGRPDELKRIDLIKGQGSKGARLSAVAERRGVIGDALTECCPVGGWVEIDELFRQMQMHGHHFEVSHNPWGLYFSDPQYGSLGYDSYGGFEILQARFILVYLFEYLATLGMIDVAYAGPIGARPDYHGAWGVDEFSFLSRYDGLRYIRLNALGAYCLGCETEYRPVVDAMPNLFITGEDLSLTLLRKPQPAETLVLEQIATHLTQDHWRLNPDAVLMQSADPAERERIREFLEASSDGTLPPQVVQLLDTVAERATALSDAGAAHLIKCKDKAIAMLLTSDPATAAHCMRAGDRLICVAEPKLTAFRKGLARLGFVLPASFRG